MPEVTREMIRTALAGKKLQNKVLVELYEKYGVSNLSEVREEDYEALLKEAGML